MTSSDPEAPAPEPARSPGRGFSSLRRASEFDRVFAEGKRHRKGPFTFVVRPTPGEGLRVGFKIGRRAGKAHVRNRIRRRFKALFELFECRGNQAGADIVVLADARCADLPFDELRRRARPVLAGVGLEPRVPSDG